MLPLKDVKYKRVALRKESVDRKIDKRYKLGRNNGVALRKESVDRKMLRIGTLRRTHKSLSARRAWIEKLLPRKNVITATTVALRKESVDRKDDIQEFLFKR